MFAPLTHYQDPAWGRRHPLIRLSTLWEEETYVVFAVIRTPTDPALPGYIDYDSHPVFTEDGEFEAFIRQLEEQSLFRPHLTVRAGDALLQLSTCVGDDRLVVAARRLRDNENPSAMRRLLADGSG